MKEQIVKIVVAGEVDHGKSSLIGRMMLDTGSLPDERLQEIKKISQQFGKDFELAYLMDRLSEEQQHQMTFDTSQAIVRWKRKRYVLIDTPGHEILIKNMISGSTFAQTAILVIDAHEGIKDQTRRHLNFLKMLGLPSVGVVLNKMDRLDYSQNRYLELSEELKDLSNNLNIQIDFIVPLSAKTGCNIVSHSSKMIWYKGPNLLEALESSFAEAKADLKPLRFGIQDIYEIEGERIIVGKVNSGSIRNGEDVLILPSYRKMHVKEIKVFDKRQTEARVGECVGLLCENDDGAIHRGDMVVAEKNPPDLVTQWKGLVFWISEKPLTLNDPIKVQCVTQEVSGKVKHILRKFNTASWIVKEENAEDIKMNEASEVLFETHQPLIIEKFSPMEDLGRFVLYCGDEMRGVGIVI